MAELRSRFFKGENALPIWSHHVTAADDLIFTRNMGHHSFDPKTPSQDLDSRLKSVGMKAAQTNTAWRVSVGMAQLKWSLFDARGSVQTSKSAGPTQKYTELHGTTFCVQSFLGKFG